MEVVNEKITQIAESDVRALRVLTLRALENINEFDDWAGDFDKARSRLKDLDARLVVLEERFKPNLFNGGQGA